ncbi:TPA: D-alanyl-D-alanine carboxypeptidase family protein [Clostridioides difficile]|uniref:D-alanyl-D-alanine carboxypeptidase family protein n=1 Tax=Clostridioides difficile TaxID=1496 RepID=UPI0008A556A5|nr:D-alanyl-D-alanine carboxypeptidase [Clostridioides difficile]OFU00561.1 D-alanyl-D-alanine carboxypeptidase [Clostridium sp. HMSC19D07]EIS9442470.1 D-alanyl-D-alanine carboxypeptidase [Clostridioides difficile]EJX2684011.1 D-alanyl-D-alanine carboxypeptidase [Clostridioides difficile]MBG0294263.1 D-alanyl-D-alanine carboxypeptidase [Clostridioides difficile]
MEDEILKGKIKQLTILALIFIFITPVFAFADTPPVPNSSRAALLIDQETKRILFEKNIDEKMPLASLSKMMTFLLAIEAVDKNQVKETDMVKIDKSTASVGGSTCKLKDGDEISLGELMQGLMLVSGNDAAIAIAKHIGKTEKNFVNMMNKKAEEIGMIDTYYFNPNGLPIYTDPEHKEPPIENMSTAHDIVTLGKYMYDHYENQVTRITTMQVYNDTKKDFTHYNTNPLLVSVPGVDGIKTGYTDNAGYCLAFSMMVPKDAKNERNHRLIGVVLGDGNKKNRISSSATLLKYGKDNFHSKKIAHKGDIIETPCVDGIDDFKITVKVDKDLYGVVSDSENIYPKVVFKNMNYPIHKGDIVGVAKYYNDSGKFVGSVDVKSESNIGCIPLKDKIKIKVAKINKKLEIKNSVCFKA